MNARELLAAIASLIETDESSPSPAPSAPAAPPAGAQPHSIDPPAAVQTPAPSTPVAYEPAAPAPTQPPAVPPAGALPHSLDDHPVGVDREPVYVGQSPSAPSPVAAAPVTADPLPSGPADSEQLISPASLRYEPGNPVFVDGQFGIVVACGRDGIRVGRFAAVDGPIWDV